MKKTLRWLAIGWAVAYFGDSQQGARRRAMAKDKAGAYWRRLVRHGERGVGGGKSYVSGRAQRVKHLGEEPKEYDDATLADKVKSEVFRPADAPKGDVNVNVANGVVELRGQVDDSELIDELVGRVRKVHGVRDVQSYLQAREEPGQSWRAPGPSSLIESEDSPVAPFGLGRSCRTFAFPLTSTALTAGQVTPASL